MNVAQLIARTRRDVYGSSRVQMNRLRNSMTDSTDTATFEFTTARQNLVREGSYLGIEDEVVYVWQVNSSSSSVTVERAVLGTEAAEHVGGTLIEIDPRFPSVELRDALQTEIRSWPPGVYATGTVELDVGVTTPGVDLAGVPSNWSRILEVLRSPILTGGVNLADNRWPQIGFRAERNLNTDDFSSGSAIFLDQIPQRVPAFSSPVFTIRVTYAIPFTVDPFTDGLDLEDDIGLVPTMFDIPVLGAAWRLLAPREVQRTDAQAQGESRVDTGVRSGDRFRTAAQLKALRDQRLREETERLLGLYGWKM